jgi:FkbM family methyltransferase
MNRKYKFNNKMLKTKTFFLQFLISKNILLIKIYKNLMHYFFNKSLVIYNLLYKIKPNEYLFLNNNNRYILSTYKKFKYKYDLSQVACNWNFFGINLKYKVYDSIHREIKNCHTIFDIGANVGFFSFECLSINSKLIIHAFEPNFKNYIFFMKNIKLNNIQNVKLNNFGFYSSNKYLYETNENITNSGTIYYSEKKKMKIHNKKFITGDNYILRNNISKVDCIKIDVEGAEYQILLGFKKLLKANNVILHLEVDNFNLKKFKSSYSKLRNFLLECNYKKFNKINFKYNKNHYDLVCRK